MSDVLDRRVAGVLAALVLLLPLGLGGRAAWAVAVADVVVLGLLAATLRERRRRAPADDAPGSAGSRPSPGSRS
ncbi:MAG: hypothetical protein KIT14_08325 [bacterium]|nr:hypothetical protein [bacterium]